MNYIKITVREKRAKCNGRERIVCGNSDYVIKFDFDDEWAAYDTKTARFVYDGGKYTDVQFTGDEVGVPVLRDTRTVSVGCYAGDIRTTTAALIQAVPCCTDPDGTPADPAPDVYNQLMIRFNTAVRTAEQSFTDAEKAQARANIGAMDETLGLRAQEVTYTMFGRTETKKIYIETGTLTAPADDATDEIKTKYNGIVYNICNSGVSRNPAGMEGFLKGFILLYQAGLLSAEFRAYKDPFKSVLYQFAYSPKRKRLGAYFVDGDTVVSCWQEEDTGEIKYSTVESHTPLMMNVTADGQRVMPQQTMKADPTADMQIATKHYVDSEIEAGKEKWELLEKYDNITEPVAKIEFAPEGIEQCKKIHFNGIIEVAGTGSATVWMYANNMTADWYQLFAAKAAKVTVNGEFYWTPEGYLTFEGATCAGSLAEYPPAMSNVRKYVYDNSKRQTPLSKIQFAPYYADSTVTGLTYRNVQIWGIKK